MNDWTKKVMPLCERCNNFLDECGCVDELESEAKAYKTSADYWEHGYKLVEFALTKEKALSDSLGEALEDIKIVCSGYATAKAREALSKLKEARK